MYDTENRILTVNIDNNEYELFCNTRALTKIIKKYKDSDLENFNKGNADPETGLDMALFMFTLLHNEAKRYRAIRKNESYKETSQEYFETIFSVKALTKVSEAIKRTIEISNKIDVETEEQKNLTTEQ